jgi:hypothetical protein
MLVASGHEMEAIEIQGGRPRRMREGLATKHVQHGRFGWQLAKGQRLTARIDADLESDQRLPILVIDGKELSWSQVGHMLMTFEGFTVDMLVRDTIEVVGGPLLEEAKAKTES